MPVLRSTYRRDLAAARAEADRLRTERDTALKQRDAFKSAASTSARQFAEADAANTRLAGRNQKLARRLEQPASADTEYVTQLEQRFDQAHRQLKEMADQLAAAQSEPRIEGGHARTTPLTIQLRQARDHARALEQRLAELQAANERAAEAGEHA